MTRWLHPPALLRPGKKEGFDPVVEGARHGLAPELSLAIWQRICAALSHGARVPDIDQACNRFHDIAARIASRSMRLAPCIGKWTRADIERESDGSAIDWLDDLMGRAPGGRTMVEMEARRWRRIGVDRQRRLTAVFIEVRHGRALQPQLAEQARLTSADGRTWYATFSPDGRRIVTTNDKGAQVWDGASYRLLFTLAHGDIVYQAVYANDGTRIVTAGGDNTVRIWEAADGTLVRELKHDGKRLRYGAVAAYGNLVAAIDLQGEIARVWDTATGDSVAELRNDASLFYSLAFSADGRWLATSGGNDVRVFDTHTWVQVQTIPGPGIHGLSWDPSGPRLLTGSTSGDVSIWAIPSGVRIQHLREFGEPVDAVAFSPSGGFVVAASRDGAEQVWSAASGTLQSQGNYLRSKIFSVEFDPTSKLVVAAGASGRVAVADVALGMPVAVLEGPQTLVWVAHFDPSSGRVIGASSDGAWGWNAASPYRRWSSPPIRDECGVVTSLEPDRRFIAVSCRGHNTRVWDTARDQLLAELPNVTEVEGDFASAYPALSAAGERAAIAHGNSVQVYELPGGRPLHTISRCWRAQECNGYRRMVAGWSRSRASWGRLPLQSCGTSSMSVVFSELSPS